MREKFGSIAIIAVVCSMIATPTYARGFGGFGGGGFHGFSGGGGFHGFDGGGGFHGFSGGGGGFHGFDGGSGFHGFDGHSGGYSGGYAGRASTDRSSFSGADNRFGGGFNSLSGNRTATSGQGMSGWANEHHQTPQNVSANSLQTQSSGIRNSFNNDSVTKNGNEYNFNHYGNNYAGYHGYGAYGGYHPYGYGAYGYHGYGYGYPGAWCAPGWSEATAWTCMGLSSLNTFLGIAALSGSKGSDNSQPVSSSNVVYEGDNVYINGQPTGSAAQYYQQSQQLAAQGQANCQQPSYDSVASMTAPQPSMQNQQWQALGVFALAEPGESTSNMMLQLAINPDGTVRGNYYNQLTGETSQVYGQLDKTTQRISWTIGTNTNTVFDAGLSDLVANDSTVLVHYGPSNTSRMCLVRLQQPPTQAPNGPATSSLP